MGRYVVVEFLDNAEADDFVAEFHTEWARLDGRARVSGLFARPGIACRCEGARRSNYGDKNLQVGVIRGGRFGWWVCTGCGKPRLAGNQLINLLRAADLYELPQANEGWELLVDGLSVSSYNTQLIPKRPKMQRLKRLLKRKA